MLGSLKRLFFKDTREDLATSIPEPVAMAPVKERPTVSNYSAPRVTATKTAPRPAFTNGEPASSECITLPLQAILARLPNSLASAVQSQGNGLVSFPAQRIIQELSKGSVKIPFGELRQVAPPGTFFDNARLDQVLVELPLAEIVARLNPSLLARRPDQRQIHLAPEITNIFGPRGEGISLSSAAVNASRASAPAAPSSNTSVLKNGDAPITASSETSFRTGNMAPVTPSHIFSSPTAVVPPPQIVIVEPESTAPVETLVIPLNLLCDTWPELIRVEMRELRLTNVPVAFPLDKLGDALKAGKIIFAWKQICAWMQPPTQSSSVAQNTQVELPLRILAPLFMAKHRAKAQKKVIVAEAPDLFAQKASAETFVEIEPTVMPTTSLAATPAPPVVPVNIPTAPAAKTEPAPLSAPTPNLPGQPKLQMQPDNIMSLPQSAEVAPPVEIKPEPVESQPVIALEPTPTVANPKSIGEVFGQPARHTWSPAEVLKNLTILPGVAGGFLAMQDGLLVAAELPSTIKAETVAAFLPQIFGRMNQYSKELQLGGLSSLTFVVNEVSWQIVKSGVVYLVALGRPNENLPSASLNLLAAELSKQMQ